MVRPYDVPYILRTRDYYRAQGYKKDYQWAYHPDAPFTPLPKPLAASTVTVITTAMPDTAPGRAERRVYSMACEPIPNSMYTGGLSWDEGATHTRDVNSFLPLRQAGMLVKQGKLGALAARFHCVPTTYSQRATTTVDAPEILGRCRQDGADVALLVPL